MVCYDLTIEKISTTKHLHEKNKKPTITSKQFKIPGKTQQLLIMGLIFHIIYVVPNTRTQVKQVNYWTHTTKNNTNTTLTASDSSKHIDFKITNIYNALTQHN